MVALAVGATVIAGCSGTPAGDSAPAPGARTVQTALGEVTVPERIESVVVLEGRRDLDIVLALGLPLVGFPYEGPDSGLDLRAPLADATEQAEAAGARELFLADEIDLEAIAQAAPSLIVGRIGDAEPILDELRAIAPVLPVRSHDDGVSWQEDLRLVAAATGTEARAEKLVAEYERRRDEVAGRFADQIASTPVVPLGYDGSTTEVQTSRMQSVVLTELGARPAQAFADAAAAGPGGVEYSPEQTFDRYRDAGAVLVLADTADEWAAAGRDRLWQQLPAVQQGNVVRADRMTHEGGPITAMHVLGLVEQLYSTV